MTVAADVAMPNRSYSPDTEALYERYRILSAEVEARRRSLMAAEERIDDLAGKFAAIPSIRPIRDGRISSGFGYRTHPITGNWEFHEGVDIPGNYTTPIYATADGAVVFESVYAQDSWTKASIATMLTSLYPQIHGAVGWDDRLPSELVTLPELLRKHGYFTAAFVTASSVGSLGLNFEQGFDQFVAMTDDHHDSLTAVAEVMSKLEPWIDSSRDKNFFLYVHLMDPHSPYFPVPPYDTMFDPGYEGEVTGSTTGKNSFRLCSDARDIEHVVALYDGEIAYTDEFFGQFIDELEEHGVFDGTSIFLTSDHGEEFKEHGAWEHGHTLYEELIRIPLIIKLPHGDGKGRRIDTRVRHLDIAPTMLELAGVKPPESYQGKSLAPFIGGTSDMVCEYVFSEQNLNRDVLYSVIRGKHKYILRTRPRFEQELYDLETDPGETRNLVREQPAVAGDLARRVIDIVSGSGRVSHIRFVSTEEAVWTGKILCKGMIARVEPAGLDDNDNVTLGYSADMLTFTVHTSGEEEGFDFVTAPADVPLVFDLACNGDRLGADRLFLGPERIPASTMPFNTERFVDTALLYALDAGAGEVDARPSCLFWKSVNTGSPASTKTSLDRETFDKLKALGYVE